MRNIMISKYSAFLFLSAATISAYAQDDLLNIANKATPVEKEYVTGTFKTTRNINFHTVETVGRHTLDFCISHRFGAMNSGAYDFWGLDQSANIRLGLEYSHDGRLMFGIGRSSYNKMYDGFLKYRLIKQTVDDKTPLSITLLASMFYTAQKDLQASFNGYDRYQYGSDRLYYSYQVMAGRKFNDNFSLQVAPFLVHANLVERISDKNDCFGVAVVTRLKFTKRQAITAEYAYRINTYSYTNYYNSLGVGWEIETGGHVFQVHVTNSYGIADNQFLMFTNTKWNNMGIRLGFNISRVFTL
jgi:hypothetical protein